ncbi:MAG: hypothetical protein CMH57_12810 [Myxococcales bacterium]|nr:hypothetical protein [Myxococcales bacterium]
MPSNTSTRPLHRAFVAALLLLAALGVGCDRSKPPVDETANQVRVEPAPDDLPDSDNGLWEDAAAAQVITAPFLWRVDGGGGDPVYLMGTIHLGVDARQELPPVVWDSLKASQTFVMEADISQVNPFALGKYIQLPPGESLQSKLEPDVWRGVRELVSDLLPEPILARSQPWYVNILIVQQLFPKTPPMDMTLLAEAKQQKMALGFLETVDDQFGMLSGLPEAYSIKSLNQAVREGEQLRQEIDAMLSGYRAGDAAGLEALIIENDSFKEWPEARDTMLLDRNARWMTRIEGYVKQGDVFIAVGLGHLLGEGSVVDLLRDKGYTVQRVTP